MARPQVRTRQLLRDDMVQIKELFGTAKNAYALLSLEGRVAYNIFYRALGWLPVKPAEVDIIAAHWEAWRARFLVDQVAGQRGFRLPAGDLPRL
jgi:hypothetical protein